MNGFHIQASLFKNALKKSKAFFVLCSWFLFPHDLFSQDCKEIAPDGSFTVRSVSIRGRWVPDNLKRQVNEMVGIGEPFSDSKVSAAQLHISDEAKKFENHFPPQLSGAVVVSLVTVSYCAGNASKEVEIVFNANYLRVDLFNIGNNSLPIPRSAKPSFYDNIPQPLLILTPVIGFSNDVRYGPAFALETLTDLLHPQDFSKGSKKLKLNLGIDARKSLSHNFYNLGGNIELAKPLQSTGTGWAMGINYNKKEEPMGSGEWEAEKFSLHGILQGVINTAFLKKYMFGGGFRSLKNSFNTTPSAKENNEEKGYTFFLLSDGLLKSKFGRFGIWFDHGLPENKTSYQRITTRLGYGTSIKTKRDAHQTFDFEFNAGAGHSWGSVPVYNQFYAGNTASAFLYESFVDTRIRTMPAGPVVRSIGEKDGSLPTATNNITGGKSYWHLNLNFSIPVSRWSRPLIPAIVIDETTGATLQSRLKSLAKGSAVSGVAIDLIDNKGYPENEQTDSIAERIVEKDILPMIEFVTDRANLFSFKPVLLFDIAGMNQTGVKQTTWAAAGAGFQLTIVIARFQLGYMHTLAPSFDKGKGNLFLQFVFENFY